MKLSPLAAGVLLLLAGCATTIPGDPAKMSAEQLRAWAADKNANMACSTFKGVYGTGVVNYVILDKGVLSASSVSVDAECKIVVTNAPAAK